MYFFLIFLFKFIYSNDSDNSDDEIQRLCSPKKVAKSSIEKLAESRKAKKSIYTFGPAVHQTSTKASKSILPTSSCSTGNSDLLGRIMKSQTQLNHFGKTKEESLTRNTKTISSSDRMRAAILSSRSILDRLDEDRRNRQIALDSTADHGVLSNFRIPKVPRQSEDQQPSNVPSPLSREKRPRVKSSVGVQQRKRSPRTSSTIKADLTEQNRLAIRKRVLSKIKRDHK